MCCTLGEQSVRGPVFTPGRKYAVADRHNRVTVYFCHRRLNELFTCEGEVIASGGTVEESPAYSVTTSDIVFAWLNADESQDALSQGKTDIS